MAASRTLKNTMRVYIEGGKNQGLWREGTSVFAGFPVSYFRVTPRVAR